MTGLAFEPACELCDGVCRGADLDPLLEPELGWLWRAVGAAADRRGDRDMTEGPALTIVLPDSAAERSAVPGLTGGRRAGQRVKVDLHRLTLLVHARGESLTPGAVAAHALGRVLAENTTAATARRARREAIRAALVATCNEAPDLSGQGDHFYEALRQTGWVARHDGEVEPAMQLIIAAATVTRTVIGLRDGDRRDRRLLVPGSPHALDEGTALAGTTLSLLTALGLISADPGTAARALWDQVGIDCDDLMGGLAVLGFYPSGWELPLGSTCTIPPRELARATWNTDPGTGDWIFVTENPSVLAAAADMVGQDRRLRHVRLVCTLGTPSALEIAALARAATVGWCVAVRADFDPAGLRHVAAMLKGIPGATPWRMTWRDLEQSLPVPGASGEIPPTPWDESLGRNMHEQGCVAFEEALLPQLLDDLRRGTPGST